jgi:hypothetical protein
MRCNLNKGKQKKTIFYKNKKSSLIKWLKQLVKVFDSQFINIKKPFSAD